MIWQDECLGNHEVRVLATKDWLLEILERVGLQLAIEIAVVKQRRAEAKWGYSLAEERVSVTRAVVDKCGEVSQGPVRKTENQFPSS